MKNKNSRDLRKTTSGSSLKATPLLNRASNYSIMLQLYSLQKKEALQRKQVRFNQLQKVNSYAAF